MDIIDLATDVMLYGLLTKSASTHLLRLRQKKEACFWENHVTEENETTAVDSRSHLRTLQA